MILTEGYATENGELALGRNLKVAFMPWKGYNYEDAIVLNERMVREDILTSVHVSEYSLEVRETKRGMEELTSDIPNVSEDATKDLDERGIEEIQRAQYRRDVLKVFDVDKAKREERLYAKVCRILDNDSDTLSPIGQLIDKELYGRLDEFGKQKYILELAEKFRELSRRYYLEHAGNHVRTR